MTETNRASVASDEELVAELELEQCVQVQSDAASYSAFCVYVRGLWRLYSQGMGTTSRGGFDPVPAMPDASSMSKTLLKGD